MTGFGRFMMWVVMVALLVAAPGLMAQPKVTYPSWGGTGTTTVFTAGSVVFAGANGVYKQSNGQLFFDATNYRLGIGTAAPTVDLTFGGEAARAIGMVRRSATAATGLGLTITGGGAKSGSTDKAGGDLTLASGTSTGSGSSKVVIATPAAGSTGTTDHAAASRCEVSSTGLVCSTPIIAAQAALTSASNAVVFNAAAANSFKVAALQENTTLTVTGAVAGQVIDALICQDGSGSRTFTWPSNMKGGMTIAATASKCNAQRFVCDGTNCWATSAGSTGM